MTEYVLVPREPTKAMLNALGYDSAFNTEEEMRETWAEVIAAAPVRATGGELREVSPAQIEQGWRDTFSVENPFCPCDLKSFGKAVRWALRQTHAIAPAGGLTVEREILENADAALSISNHKGSAWSEYESPRWEIRSALGLPCERRSAAPQDGEADQPVGDDVLPCGHPRSLLEISAETGLPLYCGYCDALSRARDAEGEEEKLRPQLTAAEAERERAVKALRWALPLAKRAMEECRYNRVSNGHLDMKGTYRSGETWVGITQEEIDAIEFADAAIAAAVGDAGGS